MEMFSTYIIPVIVGICLIVGYIVKNFTEIGRASCRERV